MPHLWSGHARQQPFTKPAAQLDRAFAPGWIVAQRDERSFGRSRIAFSQSAKEPGVRGTDNGASDGTSEEGVPVHSTRAVLVDRRGTIRGYYDITAADAVTKLLADTSHLLREQPR